MIKAYFANDTFRPGESFSLNACVGQNGHNDIVSYELGYDKAVRAVVADTLANHSHVDLTIYPILFLARHRLELYLKRLIRPLEEFNRCLATEVHTNAQTKVHDLQKLFDYVYLLSSADIRLSEPIEQLKVYVKDYYDVDLTGETFRYPESFMGIHHLDEFSCINVVVFYEKYIEMSKIMENLAYLVDWLEAEYQQGTYLKLMPRNIIADIARTLPNRNNWSDPAFTEVKAKLKEKYKIGSKQLCDALNLIQKHITFSNEIGVENQVMETTTEDFEKLMLILSEYRVEVLPVPSSSTNRMFDFLRFDKLFAKKATRTHISYLEIKYKYEDRILEEIPKTTILAVLAFQEIGFHRLYPEQYAPIVSRLCSQNLKSLVFDVLLNSLTVRDQILRGLEICRQEKLIGVL